MSKNKRSFKLKTREQPQSQRQLQVSQGIHRSLVECFTKSSSKLGPRLYDSPLSITKVNISPDLKIANCFFLPFNTNLSPDEILDAIEESRFVIRNFVTRQVNLKYSPQINFYYDSGFENSQKVEELLKKG